MDPMKADKPEASDHAIFQESVAELNRIVRNNLLATLGQISALLAALAAPLFITGLASEHHLGITFITEAILLLILALQLFDLSRHNRTRLVRDLLAKQLKVAVKQRIRVDQLYGLSILDPLTGLNNRRFGEQRLEEEVARSERSGDSVALILFDLDYFKEINDQFGHAAGDAALKEFSRKLKRAVRGCDVPVRMGGDEFLVILPECPREKVDTILDRIGSPEIRVDRQVIAVRYSVGRAHHQIGDTSQSMLERADQVLYAAKASRKKNDRVGEKIAGSSPGKAFTYESAPVNVNR